MHLIEKIILGSIWFFSFISIWFIPKQKYRQASFIFLFTQLPSWIIGILVVEFGWIEYPFRELSKANSTSFTFEYLILPIISIFFILYYPEGKSFYKKSIYTITILVIFTLVEYLIEKYTLLIKYINWEWYFTFITMGILLFFVKSIYKWYFNLFNSMQ